MATPAYQGAGQPPLDNGGGFLSRLGSIFGEATPAYAGDGQPSSNGGILSRVTPAYMPAPDASENGYGQTESVEALSSCPIDPAALASGHIAIVIPRNVVADRDEPAATD